MINGKAAKIDSCAVRLTGLSTALYWPVSATSEAKKMRPRQGKHGHIAALEWEVNELKSLQHPRSKYWLTSSAASTSRNATQRQTYSMGPL